MLEVTVIFAIINSVLLIALLYIYVRIAIRSKGAVYPVGLSFFAFLLLLKNLLAVFSYTEMWPLFGLDILPYLFAVSVLEFGGLVALLKVTL
jgi:hypothetical protein